MYKIFKSCIKIMYKIYNRNVIKLNIENIE